VACAAAACGALLVGCGSSFHAPKPGSPSYDQAVSYVKQAASHPDWSTYGLVLAARRDLATAPLTQRKVTIALLAVYAQQLADAHQLPAAAPRVLITAMSHSTPGIRVFLRGPGTKLQAAFLRSNAFKITLGHQLGCLAVQGIGGSC
jgi:hypothetical protein